MQNINILCFNQSLLGFLNMAYLLNDIKSEQLNAQLTIIEY